MTRPASSQEHMRVDTAQLATLNILERVYDFIGWRAISNIDADV